MLWGWPSFAANPAAAPKKIIVKAVRLTQPISVDGEITEAFWRDDLAVTDFVQRDPNEGTPATEKTVVDVAYDDSAIYVAARMYDSNPGAIVARLARKDVQVDSDSFTFYVDSYCDRRTGFYFTVNAAGTQYDGTLYNDMWDDNSWDGIWEGKAHIDDKGWSVEMRIPFSQLRFQKKEQYIWGINFKRTISRKNENDYLVYTPKNGQGFVSRFADLQGIEKISPPRRRELIPYVTSKVSTTHPEAGDPFHGSSAFNSGYGADMRFGIGPSLTLNATVNPDFGQVEVDPAVVNLSDVETYFQEKRPFFIEGSSIFDFGYGGASDYWGFNWGNPTFFYTRRIGRAPQGELPDNDFSDVPSGTQILTAAKLTGKLAGSWNVGSLLAVTDSEYGKISSAGETSSLELEPLTYYNVTRVQKEFQEGRQGLGFMTTMSHRNFDSTSDLENQLNKDAFVFGVDGWSFLDSNKTWVFGGWTGFSSLHGSAEAMTELQESSRHYFQRPDVSYLDYDPTATSLAGSAGRFYVNKEKGNVTFNSAFGFITPGFDVNDVGFMFRTDQLNGHVATGYRWTNPGKFYRSARVNVAAFRSYDFGGDVTWTGLWSNGFLQFLNYYQVNYSLAYNPESVNDTQSRGGPQIINPPGWEGDINASTDSRSRLVFNLGYHGQSYAQGAGTYHSVYGGGEWKPSSNLSLQITPQYEYLYTNSQYVDTVDDSFATHTYGKRYVFGVLNQRTFSSSIRLNWTFTPKLSLQLYGQPLISSADYTDFGELARPKSYDFNRYGSNTTLTADNTYIVDPDGAGPAPVFEFDNPNFNFKSLRGNAILRWEFKPGSTVYFVWTQDRQDQQDFGDFRFAHSLDRLLTAKADNVFLIKFSYYWNL